MTQPRPRSSLLRAEEMLPFIGRVTEVIRARALLAEHRLLTLTGPGGSGKTRLALRVMREASAAGIGGWAFVDLSGSRDLQTVPDAIAGVHGMHLAGGDPVADLADRLSRSDRVLVLDNLEQLPDAGLLVAELLLRAPRLRVLATSRSTLRVRGEQLLHVGPFPVPPARRLPVDDLAGIDSVAFLVDRVRALDPGFTLSVDQAPAIAAICRKLDGLALALELASPHVRTLGPAEVAHRLETRLGALGDASLDTPLRHRTLQATIAWGVDLLTAGARALLADLATFRGAFGLDAFAAVASEGAGSTPHLDELVRHNLVMIVSRDPRPTYRLLATVREFALDELGTATDREVAANRHAAFHLALAIQASAGLVGPDQATWLARVSAADDDIDAAFDHLAATGDTDGCLHLAVAMGRAWNATGREIHGLRRLRAALETDARAGAVERIVRQRALSEAARFSAHHEDAATARALATSALDMAERLGDVSGGVHADSVLGLVDIAEGRPDDALHRFLAMMPAASRLGDPRLEIMIQLNASIAATRAGNGAAREDAIARAERLARTTGDRLALARALGTDAIQLTGLGALESSRVRMRAAITAFDELGDTEDRVRYQVHLAKVEARLGHPETALQLLGAALPSAIDLSGALVVEEALEAAFELLLAQRQVAAAEALWPLLLTLARRLGSGAFPQPGTTDAARRLVAMAGTGTARSRLALADVRADTSIVAAALEAAVATAREPAPRDARTPVRRPGIDLTSRELEVLGLLVRGGGDQPIADALGISRKTASVHVSNIKGKLGVETRTAAVLEALRLGLATTPEP